MPLNGLGTYAAPASTWNPATTNTTINSTDWAALLADVSTALSTAMFKDGQATPTANIPMGGFRLTGVGLSTAVTDAARVSQVQNSSYTSLTAVSGTNTVVGTATPTPAAYVVGQVFKGVAAATNTGATTLNISSLGAGAVQVAGNALVGGELIANAPFTVWVSAVTPVFQLVANGQVAPFLDTNALIKGSADGTKQARFEVDGLTTATTRVLTVQDQNITVGALARSYLAGLTMSTAGGSATMTTAAGQATDSTNVAMMALASATGKTTSAWAVGSGNGGLDTGAIANTTWYHFYLIMRLDTSVVDVLISLSASAPTMPANYTLKRRIGSGLTNGSAQWVAFIQYGDDYYLSVPVQDISAANPGTAAVTRVLASLPSGVKVKALLNVGLVIGGTSTDVYLSSLDTTDAAASATAAPLGQLSETTASGQAVGYTEVYTDTSQSIRSRISNSDASTTLRIVTLGWQDRRGRDS